VGAESPILVREAIFVKRRNGLHFNTEHLFKFIQTSVTTVTENPFGMRDTPNVNMVRRARKKALLEPGDTRHQWKGEAAASFVNTGIASSQALPTSSVGYWSPSLSCATTQAPPKRRDPSGVYFHVSFNSKGVSTIND